MKDKKNIQNIREFNENLNISGVIGGNASISKRSQIQFEIGLLLYQINSRYGVIGNIYPTEEQQLEMYIKMIDLRVQLKNIC